MRKNFIRRLVAGMALCALVATASAKAQAADFSCTQGIQQVVWNGGALFIDCIGQPNRFAAFSFARCANYTGHMDNMKLFEALATSAMISGKLLIISYLAPGTCDAVGAITALTLSR